MIIVSDAETAEEFRKEVLHEISLRMNVLFNQTRAAKTARARDGAEMARRELASLAAFLGSIHINPSKL